MATLTTPSPAGGAEPGGAAETPQPSHRSARHGAIDLHLKEALSHTSAAADLLAWVRMLQREEGAILDDEGCRSLVDEIRTATELHICGLISAQRWRSELRRYRQHLRIDESS